jgi:hypothetical protein
MNGSSKPSPVGKTGGGARVYLAALEALNAADVSNRPVDGQAIFQIDGDRSTAQVSMAGPYRDDGGTIPLIRK